MNLLHLSAILLSSAHLHANTVIPPGQQLEIDFTLPTIPPASTTGMVLTTSEGRGSVGTFMISSTLFDGETPLGPSVEQVQSVDRWILEGTTHPNPSFPLTNIAPLLDGTIQGRLILRNLGTESNNIITLRGDVQLFAASFSSFGSYNPSVRASITRMAVVPPFVETPIITAITKNDTTVNLTWTSSLDRVYRIERTESLANGPWSLVATVNGANNWTSAGFPETTPPSGRAFFRIVTVP